MGRSLSSSPVSPPLNSQGSCSPVEKASLYPLENPVDRNGKLEPDIEMERKWEDKTRRCRKESR